MEKPCKILLVEDYDQLRLGISQLLTEAEYEVDGAEDGQVALEFLAQTSYALAIVDLMLPKVDGLAVLRAIRESKADTKVLIITARDAIEDRVRGLDAGADDYLVKPFQLPELMARVRALLRRNQAAKEHIIRVADLEIDTKRRTAVRAGVLLDLTSKELALLEILASRPGEVVSRAELWEQLYDFDQKDDSNVIDVFVAYLRKKVEKEGQPKLIHTRRGLGYVLG